MTKKDLLVTEYLGKKMAEKDDFGKSILYSAIVRELQDEESPLAKALDFDIVALTNEINQYSMDRTKCIDRILEYIKEHEISPGELFSLDDIMSDLQDNVCTIDILNNMDICDGDIQLFLEENFTPEDFVKVVATETELRWVE